MTCANCGQAIEANHDWVLVEVTGWVRRRKTGGLNHILFREDTGRLMCPECALKRRYTGEQMSLLEDAP